MPFLTFFFLSSSSEDSAFYSVGFGLINYNFYWLIAALMEILCCKDHLGSMSPLLSQYSHCIFTLSSYQLTVGALNIPPKSCCLSCCYIPCEFLGWFLHLATAPSYIPSFLTAPSKLTFSIVCKEQQKSWFKQTSHEEVGPWYWGLWHVKYW